MDQDKLIKYTTVEGHPIVRDGEYETRCGEKIVVLGFAKKTYRPVVGYEARWDGALTWRADGLATHCFEKSQEQGRDIMRPWIASLDKPEAVDKEDGCKHENTITRPHLFNKELQWFKCTLCGEEWSEIVEEKKPEKQTLPSNAVIDLISALLERG